MDVVSFLSRIFSLFLPSDKGLGRKVFIRCKKRAFRETIVNVDKWHSRVVQRSAGEKEPFHEEGTWQKGALKEPFDKEMP